MNINNTYQYVLFNLTSISNDMLDILLTDIELDNLALYLKNKFKDTRSIQVIKSIILEELF